MLQFMIDHYRTRFPGCRIVVHDNMSTDNTVEIALVNNCEIIQFDTDNYLNEPRLTEIRNNCWKNATTDWVLVCDMDELLDISEAELKEEERIGTTIVRAEAYDMVDMDNRLDISAMKYGVRDTGHDKSYLFNKKFISEINYTLGAHASKPIGTVLYSGKAYKAYHYWYKNYNETVKEYKIMRARINPENIKNGDSAYAETPEELRDEYAAVRSRAIRVR